MEIQINCTLVLSEDKIKEGDLFFYTQRGTNAPTIRKAKGLNSGEEWNDFVNSKTGEKSYFKIKEIKGLLLTPKILI